MVLSYDFPIDVKIDTGDGGPPRAWPSRWPSSTTWIPGDPTGGHDIAATGTIAGDGTVGPVGGTGQKAAAVRAKGAELFLVPRADYADAVAYAGDHPRGGGRRPRRRRFDALADLGGQRRRAAASDCRGRYSSG